MATKSVLIVDDAAETRIFLKGVINSLGYKSLEAKSGLEALKILKEQKIDLIILDVLMPNLDGYQTLEYIHKSPESSQIKVVFLTGRKGEIDQDKIKSLKPNDVIHKTIEVMVLKTKIKKLLESDEISTPAATETSQANTIQNTTNSNSNIPKANPPSQSSASKNELAATIVNLPFFLDVKIIKLTVSNLSFSSPYEFKSESEVIINCPRASNALKKMGDIKVKTQKSMLENDFYVTICQII